MRKIFRSYFPTTRAFFILIAFLAITFIAIFALLDHLRSIFFSHADAQNQSVVSLAANMVDERINAKLIQLQALGYTASSQKDLSDKDLLIRRLEQIKHEALKIGYDFIQLTDQEGNYVSTSGKKAIIVEDEHFYRAIRGFSVVSNILSNDMTGTSGSSDNKMVIFSVPVFSGASVIGVLTAAINVDKISMLENINIPYSGTFLCLIDGNNSIVEYSGSFLREFPHLTRSFNFFSPLSTLIESDELLFLKEELTGLAGTVIKHHKSSKNDRILSFAALPHSDRWKLVAVSSEDSIRSQQNSLLIKIGALILLCIFLITLTVVYLYVIRWKYMRIRELSNTTISKAGFNFFKVSPDGDVMDFDDDFASFLGIHNDKKVFSFKRLLNEEQQVFPMSGMDRDTSFKLRLSIKNSEDKDIFLLVQIIGEKERDFYPAFAIDVTDDELLQEKVRDLAYTDKTTGLPNKESFILKIESLNRKSTSMIFKSGLLFIDINNSHRILEILGHRLFEKMLRDAADRLSVVAAAHGGEIFNLESDDFVIVIDDYQDDSEMCSVANKVYGAFAMPFTLGDALYEVSLRIGLVSCTEYLRGAQISPSDMLRYGEIAGRLAKKSEGVFILDIESYLSAIKELDMEVDLINSIKNCELKVKYQPVYSFGPDRITAVEALLRWENERYGNVPPSTFIAIAERCGFINQLGDFAIDTALDLASRLCSEDRGILVNFNVSSMQFSQSSFAEKLRDKFRSRNLPKDSAGLEITESCLCGETSDFIEKLEMIRREGIMVSIDDFGTGYSSLSYLKDLPIDFLKIDRSFITGIDRSEKHFNLFKSITALAGSIGVEVIAEGVETEDQLDAVLRCRCRHIQGFLISEPMDEDALMDFIKTYTGPGKESCRKS